MEWIKKAWRGEESLWKVFWIYGVVFGIVFKIVGDMLKSGFGVLFVVLYGIIYLAYVIWLMVSQWRCAFNTDWIFWGYVVRVFIILPIVFLVGGLLVGGGLIGHDLMIAAECRKEMKAYAANGGTDTDAFKKKCIEDHMGRKDNTATSGTESSPPLSVNADIPPDQLPYYQACQKTMADFARDRKVDPQQYIAQNQDYLQQCVQYYIKDASSKKKAP